MNTRKLISRNYEDYSFRDLEYGVKLLVSDISEIDRAIHTLHKLIKNAPGNKSAKYHEANGYGNAIDLLFIRKEKILKAINMCEEEISERLLTGDDDGTIERELLGQLS